MKFSTSLLQKFALGFLALAPLFSVTSLHAEEAKLRKVTPATKQYDADGDGFLNETESEKAKEGARAKAKATREEKLAKYDTNKDGKLDDAEKARRKADLEAAKEARSAEKEPVAEEKN